jgi:hypothetical protein
MELLEREQCRADLWTASVQLHGGCTALLTGEAGISATAFLQGSARRQSGHRAAGGDPV